MVMSTERIRRAWAEFVGPEATPTNTFVTLSSSVAATVGAMLVARRRGGTRGASAVSALLALDLAGGAYVNNTRASARWYERPGQGDAQHLTFAALHVHPAVIAWLDGSTGRRSRPVWWACAHYGYMVLATSVIRRNAAHRRVLGVATTAGGLALDRGLGSSSIAPWFASAYYPKLLMGHAAASLWSDDQLVSAR